MGRWLRLLPIALLCGLSPAWATDTAVVADFGTCLVRPKQIVQLGSPVFGVISNILVDRADRVAKDQVVAKLDSRVEEAQYELDQYRASNTTAIDAGRVDLAWNQRELARREKLAGNMFSKANDIDEYTTKVTQDQIAIHKAEADQRVAQLEAARSASQIALKLIRSPVAGVVTEVKLRPGEYVYETTPIMTIAQVDPLSVDVVLPAKEYRVLKVGMPAEVSLGTPVDATVPATVDVIDPVIDAASGTFRVRLALPNPDNRIPAGIRCSARIVRAAGAS